MEMNRDKIVEMAREAGLGKTTNYEREMVWELGNIEAHERFAALVAAAERADAERYRWLRDNNTRFSWNPSKYNQNIVSGFAAFGTGYVGFEFEEAIDKAMKEGK